MKKLFTLMLCALIMIFACYPAYAESSPVASVIPSDSDTGGRCPVCNSITVWSSEHNHYHCPECGWPDTGCPNCGNELKPPYTHCDKCGWDIERNPISPVTATTFNYNVIYIGGALLLLAGIAVYAGIKGFKKEN